MRPGRGRRADVEREIDEEVEDYLRRRTRELMDEGMAPDLARRTAEEAFGDVEAVRRECGRIQRRRRTRAAWLGTVAGLGRDLRVGVRGLIRRPGFATVAVLTLGLGVGANTALFSVVDTVLLKPLPYPEPDRLVQVWESDPNRPTRAPSPADFLDVRRAATGFADLSAYSSARGTITGSGEPESVVYTSVSANFFRTLGVRPALGAAFGPEPIAPGERLAVLSDGFWTRRYGRDPTVVGGTLRVDDVAYTIVGVMPTGFAFPAAASFWTAADEDIPGTPFLRGDTRVLRDVWYHPVVGRLAEGVALERAGEEMSALADALARDHPAQNEGLRFRLVPLRDQIVGDAGATLWLLLGATGLVLLVACVNAANLLLARGTTRADEMALRAALGAGRARLATHAAAEAVVIAVAGALAGAALAAGLLALLRPTVASVLPRGGELALDGAILLRATLVASMTALLFGLLPARAAAREAGAMRGTRGATASTGGRRLGDALVALEVAMAVVLVLGAGLLLRSVAKVAAVDPGFEPAGLTIASVGLPGARAMAPEERTAFYSEVGARMAALPGVRGVAWTTTGPLDDGPSAGLRIEDRPLAEGDEPPEASWTVVSPGYFDVAGIARVAGRDFTASDDGGSIPVGIVNRALARRVFGDADPIGRRINTGLDGRTEQGWVWVTIVGVIADTRNQGPTLEPAPTLYRPIAQGGPGFSGAGMLAFVRAGGGPPAAASVRRAIWDVDGDAPVSSIRTGEDLLGAYGGERGLALGLLGGFATLALALGAVGTYGVTAFAVSRRTRELGVRMALGARRGSVSAMVLREALIPVGAGVLAGVVGGAALSRLLGSLLFEVDPLDPVTFAAVPLVLVGVSLAAVWIPARRAARVDPVVSLRAE